MFPDMLLIITFVAYSFTVSLISDGVRSSGLKLSGLETGLSPPSNARSCYRYPSYLYNFIARTSILLTFLLVLPVDDLFCFSVPRISESLEDLYKKSCCENKSRIIIEYTTTIYAHLTLLDNLRWQPKQTI